MITKEAIQELLQPGVIEAASAALQLAVSDFIARGEDTRGIVALPKDFVVTDLESHLPQRRRARGTMTTSRLEDWIAYVKGQAELGAAAFVDPTRMQATCVLNLGTPQNPGHADNLAIYKPETTSAYEALRGVESTSAQTRALTQRKMAEWMEDWADCIVCLDADGAAIDRRKAIAAVRAITIESARKAESVEGQLSAERSAFESIKATSRETLPAMVRFRCEPYHGLLARDFDLRLSIVTTEKEPTLVLRTVRAEWHREEMAIEMSDKVRAGLGGDFAVALGTYAAK